MRWEEQRKAQQQDAYNKQEVAKYQDQLARQRSEAEHQKHRERNMELVRLQVLTSVTSLAWLRGSVHGLACQRCEGGGCWLTRPPATWMLMLCTVMQMHTAHERPTFWPMALHGCMSGSPRHTTVKLSAGGDVEAAGGGAAGGGGADRGGAPRHGEVQGGPGVPGAAGAGAGRGGGPHPGEPRERGRQPQVGLRV